MTVATITNGPRVATYISGIHNSNKSSQETENSGVQLCGQCQPQSPKLLVSGYSAIVILSSFVLGYNPFKHCKQEVTMYYTLTTTKRLVLAKCLLTSWIICGHCVASSVYFLLAVSLKGLYWIFQVAYPETGFVIEPSHFAVYSGVFLLHSLFPIATWKIQFFS